MRVVFLPEVRLYFQELEEILFEKEYFGFEETAIKYVRELITDIEKTLPVRLSKPAPSHFDRYGKGMYYAAFRINKTTEWYVFFSKYKVDNEIVFLVRYISNNHMVAKYLK